MVVPVAAATPPRPRVLGAAFATAPNAAAPPSALRRLCGRLVALPPLLGGAAVAAARPAALRRLRERLLPLLRLGALSRLSALRWRFADLFRLLGDDGDDDELELRLCDLGLDLWRREGDLLLLGMMRRSPPLWRQRPLQRKSLHHHDRGVCPNTTVEISLSPCHCH